MHLRRPRHHGRGTLLPSMALIVAFVIAAFSGGCTGARSGAPLRDSREALGTFVTISSYGGDTALAGQAANQAFRAIVQVESVLSAYPDLAAEPGALADRGPRPSFEVSSVVQFNLDPYEWHKLPAEATQVLRGVRNLDVEDYFAPGMLRVVQLYDFEGSGTVPDPTTLAHAVEAARSFETTEGSTAARFTSSPAGTSPPSVGLDLSGGAKGLALDAGLGAFEGAVASGDLDGMIISAGSTTVVMGRKSGRANAEPWEIGIEDPRDPEKIVGIVEYALAEESRPGGKPPVGLVSTSGDYQQSFTRNGVLYHHILDPATGEPARGIRSLTVVGGESALDSDILSTALFVMGVDGAEAYARQHGLGLFIVDDEGRTRIVPGPSGSAFTIREATS